MNENIIVFIVLIRLKNRLYQYFEDLRLSHYIRVFSLEYSLCLGKLEEFRTIIPKTCNGYMRANNHLVPFVEDQLSG